MALVAGRGGRVAAADRVLASEAFAPGARLRACRAARAAYA